jgi:hypothetical protein
MTAQRNRNERQSHRRLNQRETSTLLHTCWHEAGHAIVADDFGLDWNAYVWPNPKPEAEQRLWCGQVRSFHRERVVSSYQRAVIAWAGIVVDWAAAATGYSSRAAFDFAASAGRRFAVNGFSFMYVRQTQWPA